MSSRSSAAISPTAHYTGEVWRRNGLSDPALGTIEGRVLHGGLRPVLALSGLLGGPTLEGFLLARHTLIDSILERAITAGSVGQVIEIAAGMSPRGLRCSRRHPRLVYLEADLPGMAARKREALANVEAASGLSACHRVVELDALADSGPASLDELLGDLDPGLGTAIVTEGLLNYFPRTQTDGIWSRIATGLARFDAGLYLSDLHLESDNPGLVARGFVAALSVFVRGRVHMPYADPGDAKAALAEAGFSSFELHSGREGGSAPGAELVRVIEAWSR